MALLSSGYLLTVSYHQMPSIRIPHVSSKHCCCLDHKARISNVTSNKNYSSSGAKVKDEQDHPRHQADLTPETVPKHQLLLATPLSSTTISDPKVCHESRLRVAHQGIRGAYSEAAAEKACPNCQTIPCQQFDTTFEAVEIRPLVDRAVVPIENSLAGSVHRNYDLLLGHNLHIVGEVELAVHHCLLANNGVKLEDLKRVLSHPQALAQCEKSLTELGLAREAVNNTAVAAKLQKLKDTGAVASASAAAIYGLNILAPNIQDDCKNVTRFLVLAREPLTPGTDRPFKTTIVFSLKEGPRMLSEALSVFTLRHINLLKIESRPLGNQPLQASRDNHSKANGYFNYLFYADIEVSIADQKAKDALKHLKEFATFLRVLGSYPINTTQIYE